MTSLAAISLPSLRLLMLGGAAVILYVVGRLVMGSIPARVDRSLLRALIATTSVLAVSVVAAAMGRPQVALHLPIAAAAGALTFGVAALVVGRPLATRASSGERLVPVGVRSWALLVPAVAIALVGGLGGRLDLPMIAALALYGFVALLAWQADPALVAPPRPPAEPDTPAAPADGSAIAYARGPRAPDALGDVQLADAPDTTAPSTARGSTAFIALLWLVGVALATLAGVLAMLGLPALDAVRGVPSDALATVFLLAPAIVVPIVFELLPPCRPIGWSASMSSLAKFALLNLCVVLPLVALLSADIEAVRGWLDPTVSSASDRATTLPTTMAIPNATPSTSTSAPASTLPSLAASPALIFPAMPPLALRADLLVLAGASLLLVPIASNWTRPGKLEAAALFSFYLLNLILVMGSMLR